MALFIALEVAHADDLVNMVDERLKLYEQRSKPAEEVRQFNTIMDRSWDDLVSEWEERVVDNWS
jgi:hypothetical protein